MEHGTMVISLDFELYWGVRDQLGLDEYKENLLGARRVIPRMLELFDRYHVHATWATVGFLFYGNKHDLMHDLPLEKPNYLDGGLSPYPHFFAVGKDEAEDPFHFASSLIDQIKAVPFQEIGSHTFSHYYCLEEGQSAEEFDADLQAAVQASLKKGITSKSIVFPRNQVNADYLDVCEKHGFTSYRGTEQSAVYHAGPLTEKQQAWKRGIRLMDAYMNITGHHIHSIKESALVNVPSSRYLRPYKERSKWAEPLKLRRIKKSMTKAAKEKKVFHLWWHPHDFGRHIEENCRFLTEILNHYRELESAYGMKSLNMGEVGDLAVRIGNQDAGNF